MLNESKILAEHLAISPLDGRYAKIGRKLSPYFSEFALMKYRVKTEVMWLRFLLQTLGGVTNKPVTSTNQQRILEIFSEFADEDFLEIKQIESVTNHDVKAVELFVGRKLERLGLGELVSFVHFGCTSEDINNTAYASMITDALNNVWLPAADSLTEFVSSLAEKYAGIPMLAHTHGQPATPTTVGKEFAVFAYRLRGSLEYARAIKPTAKFNGATGNYAAISTACPETDWENLSKKFVEECLGLKFNPVTTQIESHDYICHLADAVRHFNNVLLDMDIDMWLYISKEYFKQVAVKTEVGSSTMPHKVNPIRFENSEANVEISNAILVELSNKLPHSRMQRDLSDSSTLRNIGMGFGYSLQAIEQTHEGLKKVEVNEPKLAAELERKWEVLAEPIQTVLRKYGIADAYDRLKELTRGKDITKESLKEFVLGLTEISDSDRQTLLNLTPATYTGLAEKIARQKFKSNK